MGGLNSALPSAVQSIDLSTLATAIDADLLTFSVSGYFGGYLNQEDRANLVVRFRGSTNNILRSGETGIVSSEDRGDVTGLLFRSFSGARVPPGTRRVDVTIWMGFYSGDYNDGYADNLSLILTEQP